jgi:hypothetical protein
MDESNNVAGLTGARGVASRKHVQRVAITIS